MIKLNIPNLNLNMDNNTINFISNTGTIHIKNKYYKISNIKATINDEIIIETSTSIEHLLWYENFDIEFTSDDNWIVKIKNCWFTSFNTIRGLKIN